MKSDVYYEYVGYQPIAYKINNNYEYKPVIHNIIDPNNEIDNFYIILNDEIILTKPESELTENQKFLYECLLQENDNTTYKKRNVPIISTELDLIQYKPGEYQEYGIVEFINNSYVFIKTNELVQSVVIWVVLPKEILPPLELIFDLLEGKTVANTRRRRCMFIFTEIGIWEITILNDFLLDPNLTNNYYGNFEKKYIELNNCVDNIQFNKQLYLLIKEFENTFLKFFLKIKVTNWQNVENNKYNVYFTKYISPIELNLKIFSNVSKQKSENILPNIIDIDDVSNDEIIENQTENIKDKYLDLLKKKLEEFLPKPGKKDDNFRIINEWKLSFTKYYHNIQIEEISERFLGKLNEFKNIVSFFLNITDKNVYKPQRIFLETLNLELLNFQEGDLKNEYYETFLRKLWKKCSFLDLFIKKQEDLINDILYFRSEFINFNKVKKDENDQLIIKLLYNYNQDKVNFIVNEFVNKENFYANAKIQANAINDIGTKIQLTDDVSWDLFDNLGMKRISISKYLEFFNDNLELQLFLRSILEKCSTVTKDVIMTAIYSDNNIEKYRTIIVNNQIRLIASALLIEKIIDANTKAVDILPYYLFEKYKTLFKMNAPKQQLKKDEIDDKYYIITPFVVKTLKTHAVTNKKIDDLFKDYIIYHCFLQLKNVKDFSEINRKIPELTCLKPEEIFKDSHRIKELQDNKKAAKMKIKILDIKGAKKNNLRKEYFQYIQNINRDIEKENTEKVIPILSTLSSECLLNIIDFFEKEPVDDIRLLIIKRLIPTLLWYPKTDEQQARFEKKVCGMFYNTEEYKKNCKCKDISFDDIVEQYPEELEKIHIKIITFDLYLKNLNELLNISNNLNIDVSDLKKPYVIRDVKELVEENMLFKEIRYELKELIKKENLSFATFLKEWGKFLRKKFDDSPLLKLKDYYSNIDKFVMTIGHKYLYELYKEMNNTEDKKDDCLFNKLSKEKILKRIRNKLINYDNFSYSFYFPEVRNNVKFEFMVYFNEPIKEEKIIPHPEIKTNEKDLAFELLKEDNIEEKILKYIYSTMNYSPIMKTDEDILKYVSDKIDVVFKHILCPINVNQLRNTLFLNN